MRGPYAVAGGLIAIGVIGGCFDFGELGGGDASDASIDDGSPSDASQDSESDASTDANEAPDNGCPFGRGSAMVRVPTISGGTYCIDSTEVTRAQYKQFLDADYATSGQPPYLV